MHSLARKQRARAKATLGKVHESSFKSISTAGPGAECGRAQDRRIEFERSGPLRIESRVVHQPANSGCRVSRLVMYISFPLIAAWAGKTMCMRRFLRYGPDTYSCRSANNRPRGTPLA